MRRENAAAAVEDFTLDPPEPSSEPDLCEDAEMFFDWTEDLRMRAEAKGTVVAVNQAMLLLLKKYFHWRARVPKRHRSMGGRIKHVCVTNVFEAAYRQLERIELTLAPPPLAVEPPPAPRVIHPREPRTPFDGLLLGTVEPDPEFDGPDGGWT